MAIPIIAIGVIYNSARISLSEHARELASLRVLGFTQWEVFRILLLELAIIVLLAQPPGWAMGYGLAWIMKTNLAGETMRVRAARSGVTVCQGRFYSLLVNLWRLTPLLRKE